MRSRLNQITITGHPGGGKTTAAKLLARELGWEYFYTGAVQRQLAAELGISTLEFNQRSETDASLNHKIDAVYKDLNESDKPLVIDARLAFHFMPRSFKVRFEVPVEVGAQRIFEYARREDEQYRDLEAAKHALAARRTSERAHYHSSYDIDVEDHEHFDLILDTAYSLPERNVSFVRSAFSLWYKGIRLPRQWTSPRSVVPTAVLAAEDEVAVQTLIKDIAANGFDVLCPLKVATVGDQLYIIDGHKRAAAALAAGCDFIPVCLIREGEAELAGKTIAVFLETRLRADAKIEWKARISGLPAPGQPQD